MRRRKFGTLVGSAAAASAAWPLTLAAQQRAMPVVGWLSSGAPRSSNPALTAFRQALAESGYVEGQTVTIEYRWGEGRYDQLPAMAADLVGRGVDAIMAVSGPAAHAAKGASRTIPVVFVGGIDPVASGLVASLARPGGNVTGVSALGNELFAKRLELLRAVVSSATVFAALMNPSHPEAEDWIRAMQEGARSTAVQLLILKADSASAIDDAFASLVQRKVDGLLVDGDPLFYGRRAQVVALAARHAVPAVYPYREYAMAGGLISYGGITADVFRQAGAYIARILKGARPVDLPVVQPSVFELSVNLGTARTLGLTIPPSILARADEVIE